MEIGVRAEAENMKNGEIRHTASAYLTFVALDEEGRPREVSPLILKTEEEKRRHRQAEKRRKTRLGG
jgi:acyl-CoA hydrolase